ncbi:MAG: hypothetical protein Q8P07_05080 [bacterium]|nr:hypothetical protein [bacterium]
MSALLKVKNGLDEKFHKVLVTPANFDFYVAIHDFVEHIEFNPSLSKNLSQRIKTNRELRIPSKYGALKQIYQGLKDTNIKTNADLGHARYMVLRELNQIRNKDFSEGNSFWKKRELFRKMAVDVYERLSPKTV